MSIDKGIGIKEDLGLTGKFIVMYGGNVGPAQRIENLVSLAEQVPNHVDENVSDKVVKLIQSYTGVVNKMVWRKY